METKNIRRGVNMNEADLGNMIAKREARLVRQKERMEKLEQSIENNTNDIDQLKYALQKLRAIKRKKKSRIFISQQQISSFFTRISHLYDYLRRRFGISPNYTWFCLLINAHYCFESRTKSPGRNLLFPGTILSYFKRERGY